MKERNPSIQEDEVLDQSIGRVEGWDAPPKEKAEGAAAPRARIVVTDTVYFQPAGDSPTSAQSQFVRFLESDEQPYLRKIKVGELWKSLDAGWLADIGCSMLLLANDKERFETNPTDEARDAADAKVIEVAFVDDVPDAESKKRTMHSAPVADAGPKPRLLIHPGESMRVIPAEVKTVRLRCRRGECSVTINLFPP